MNEDLDQIDKLKAGAIPLPWVKYENQWGFGIKGNEADDWQPVAYWDDDVVSPETGPTRDYIIALATAWPVLSVELRALRARVALLEPVREAAAARQQAFADANGRKTRDLKEHGEMSNRLIEANQRLNTALAACAKKEMKS